MEVVTYMTIDRPIYDYSYRPIQKYLNWSLMLTLILGLFIFQISLILLNLSWCTKHQLSLHDSNILITEFLNNVTNSCFKQKCKIICTWEKNEIVMYIDPLHKCYFCTELQMKRNFIGMICMQHIITFSQGIPSFCAKMAIPSSRKDHLWKGPAFMIHSIKNLVGYFFLLP